MQRRDLVGACPGIGPHNTLAVVAAVVSFDRRNGEGRRPGGESAATPRGPGKRTLTESLPDIPPQVTTQASTSPDAEAGGVELAHEDEHEEDLEPEAMQETSDKPGVLDFKSPRFMGDPTLEAIAQGKKTLIVGAKGLSVVRLEQALIDAGYLAGRPPGQDFKFDTEAALKQLQVASKIGDSGILNQATIKALDAAFADHSKDAALAKAVTSPTKPTKGKEFAHGSAPKELTAKTHKLSASEKAEASAVLSPVTEKDPITGAVRVFKNDLGSGPYEARLRSVVDKVVDSQFARIASGKAVVHADPSNLHAMTDVEKVAAVAKDKADAVFGSYATGKAFTAVDNLRDRWAVQAKEIGDLETAKAAGGAGGKAAEGELAQIATWRVQKIVNETDVVKALNEEHGAIVSRPTEKGHITAVIAAVSTARQAELLEIHKGWPGSANPDTHEVFLQLFKSSSAVANRNFMWKTFQTMIHEYMHTLNHSRYSAYANGLPDAAKAHTLREGMTDYLTKVVWSTVPTADAALHKTVEGPYHDPATIHPVPALGTYSAAIEAEQLVGVVGPHNANAAYFLGEIELIGG